MSNIDYQAHSEQELQDIIQNATRALRDKQFGKRKENIAKIKEIAALSGLSVQILHEAEKREGRKIGKVSPKYRNPNNHLETWTGRGVMPKWMQGLTDAGHDKSEFLI
jgi:DNA-binding protein H-NS